MFIYEGKKKISEAEIVEVFNIVFESAQIPAGNPDVQVWKDSTGVHALIGKNQLDGALPEKE